NATIEAEDVGISRVPGPGEELVHQQRLMPPAERDGTARCRGAVIELQALWRPVGLARAGSWNRRDQEVAARGQTHQRMVVDEPLGIAAADEDDRGGCRSRGYHVAERSVPRDR